jgi:hypothetical protein
MKTKKEKKIDKTLIDTITYVEQGFIKGLWRHRRADIDHIFKGFEELKQRNNEKNN